MHDESQTMLGDGLEFGEPVQGRTRGIQAILHAAPAAIFIAHDTECRRITRSRAARELLRPPQEPDSPAKASLPWQPARCRVFQADQVLASPEFPMQQAARGIDVRGAELGVVFDNGAVRHIYGNAAPLRDEQGRPRGAVAVFVDVTELSQAFESVTAEARELTRSNLELEQFAAVAAHDLRSPLMSLTSSAQLLRQEYLECLPPEGRELVGYIQESADHMARLIGGILEYARAGHGEVELRQCDANLALRSAVESLQDALQATEGCVTSDSLPTIRVDESLFSQLLQNLIENAIRYCGEAPPRVHVSVRQEPGLWTFSVRDQGIGIDPQDFDWIFRVFERLPSHKPRGTGLGMGLATCKRIVERHGGRIWVESQPGQGATFLFTLPR